MAAGGAIRAGAAFVEVWLNDNRLVRGLKRAQAKLKAFGASIRAIGMRMMALGGMIAAPLVLAVTHFARLGDTINKMSARTGMGARALTELGFAAERSGSSLQTVEKGVRRMQRTIVDATRGLASAQDGFRMLGMDVKDLEGLSPEQQFLKIADAIGKVEDPTKKAAIAQMIFGRAGTELIPLMNEGAAGIDKLRKKARQLGISMSDEDAAGAAKFTDALSDLWSSMKAGAFHIGAALGTSLTDAAVRVSELVGRISHWIRENRELVIWVAKLAAVLIVGGAAIVAIGAVFGGLASIIGGVVAVFGLVGSAITALAGLFAFLVSPIGLAIAAVVALGAYILTSTTAGGDALKWLGEMFQWLVDDATSTWEGISDALAAGDIGLAAKILWLTLKMEWQRGVHALNRLWTGVKTFFLSVWTEAVFGVARIATQAWAKLKSGWENTVGFMSDAWDVFTGALAKGWQHTVAFVAKAWQKLKGAVTGEDTSGEQQRIDDELKRKDRDRQAAQDKRIMDRETKRKKKLKEIDLQEKGSLDVLEKKRLKEHDDRAEANRKSLKSTQGSLDAAKASRQAALDEAKAKRKSKKPGRTPCPPGQVWDEDLRQCVPRKKKQSLTDNLKTRSKNAFDMLSDKAETKGTFSAFALRGMQSGGPMERVAKSSAQTAQNTQAIAENTDDLALPRF